MAAALLRPLPARGGGGVGGTAGQVRPHWPAGGSVGLRCARVGIARRPGPLAPAMVGRAARGARGRRLSAVVAFAPLAAAFTLDVAPYANSEAQQCPLLLLYAYAMYTQTGTCGVSDHISQLRWVAEAVCVAVEVSADRDAHMSIGEASRLARDGAHLGVATVAAVQCGLRGRSLLPRRGSSLAPPASCGRLWRPPAVRRPR